jgi:hypothetical protein
MSLQAAAIQSPGWLNPAEMFHGNGAPPLRKANAVATQAMPRCKRHGQSVTLAVGCGRLSNNKWI